MIRLKSVKSMYGKTILSIEYDFEDKIMSIDIDKKDLDERLKALKELIGRDLTINDLKDVLKSIIDQIRKGNYPFPQEFDYNELIGQDIEVSYSPEAVSLR